MKALRNIRVTGQGLIMALLVIAGCWQLGSGAYVYAKAQLAQLLVHNAWQSIQSGEVGVKPWSWADTYPVSRLIAPQHNVDLYVLAGSSGRTLAFGPGHMSNTPLPGEPGNSVIGGHRDTHFAFLKDLKIGDTLIVETPSGQQLHYQVKAQSVTDHRDTSVLQKQHNGLTLITCYPFDALTAGGPLRYVVEARPLNNQGYI